MRSYCRFVFCFTVLVLLISVGFNTAYAQRAYPRQWNVYPQWTRGAIQEVIDNARDGDTIYFNRGTYDFSAAPPNYPFQNGGALQIIDKSLTIKGARGSILVGAPVVNDDIGMKGIVCFHIENSDVNKDVTFDGLIFQTFMVGIGAIRTNDDTVNAIYFPNLKNLVVKNCTFQDIKRNGIAVAGAQGNITITHNSINGDNARFGMYISWYFAPGQREWQPNNTLVTVRDNSIDGFTSAGGIWLQRLSNMLIIGNAISNSGTGIDLYGLQNLATVSNNSLSNLDTGMKITGTTGYINGVTFQMFARGLRLINNTFSNIRYAGIFSWGDLIYSNYIAGNNFKMTNPEWGPAIYTTGHDDKYIVNSISGYGTPAVYLGGGDSTADGGGVWGAYHEYFFANSVSGFTPNWAPWHYELDGYTHDNVVIGIRFENATYMDYGINNIFKFVYPYVSPTVTTSLMSSTSPKVQQKPKKDAATI
jgi:hypothetical protein